jgi:hypothetical protein
MGYIAREANPPGYPYSPPPCSNDSSAARNDIEILCNPPDEDVRLVRVSVYSHYEAYDIFFGSLNPALQRYVSSPFRTPPRHLENDLFFISEK